MKKNSTLLGFLWLLTATGALVFALTAMASDHGAPPAGKTGLVQADNSKDPMCGMMVDKVPAANTVVYKGKTLGFCSGYCRAAWDKLSADEKDKRFSAVMAPGEAAAAPVKMEYSPLSKPGEKIPLGHDHYFTYGFTQTPKLGASVMKVEVFTLAGRRDTTFHVTGDADMPSMRGAHATGNKDFAVSAKGFYLLPVQLVMPGDWEIRFVFEKGGETLLRGAYLFNL